MSKESERVTIHDERGDPTSIMHFKLISINYANGDLFYKGWIQDYKDMRTGPTVFPSNYINYNLDRETVIKKPKYWEEIDSQSMDVTLRDAPPNDLDELIDLNFQNYFDGGYNRISAYQGLNHCIDDSHTTICADVGGSIYGFLFIDWQGRGEKGNAYFDSLYCAPAIRGHGIGGRLIAAGISRAKKKKLRSISGEISGSLEHCRQVYRLLEKHGFSIADYNEPWQNWYILNVRLDLHDEKITIGGCTVEEDQNMAIEETPPQ